MEPLGCFFHCEAYFWSLHYKTHLEVKKIEWYNTQNKNRIIFCWWNRLLNYILYYRIHKRMSSRRCSLKKLMKNHNFGNDIVITLKIFLFQYLRPLTRLGAFIISPARCVTKRWMKKRNSTKSIWNLFARNVMTNSRQNFDDDCVKPTKWLRRKQLENIFPRNFSLKRSSAMPVSQFEYVDFAFTNYLTFDLTTSITKHIIKNDWLF